MLILSYLGRGLPHELCVLPPRQDGRGPGPSALALQAVVLAGREGVLLVDDGDLCRADWKRRRQERHDDLFGLWKIHEEVVGRREAEKEGIAFVFDRSSN